MKGVKGTWVLLGGTIGKVSFEIGTIFGLIMEEAFDISPPVSLFRLSKLIIAGKSVTCFTWIGFLAKF